MGFGTKDDKRPVHASMNSFESAKEYVKNDLKGAAGVLGNAAKDAVTNVAGHAKGMTRFANSDIKRKMTSKSGRAIDN